MVVQAPKYKVHAIEILQCMRGGGRVGNKMLAVFT